VSRDMEEQSTKGVMPYAPGTKRCAAWHRESEQPHCLGERLYRDHIQRQLKMTHLQTKAEDERRHAEERELTLHPRIENSQKSCQGVGRSLVDPGGEKTKSKLDKMRKMKERSSMDGCTFKPQIDQRSEMLMTQRITRLKITGNLYDHLYEDAQRRQERQVEYSRSLPQGVTFHPDIGVDHHRPPNDDTKEDFVNRLAYSKSYSEKWLSVQRQQQQQGGLGGSPENNRSMPEFHPQTGRGPMTERNKEGLPIGEFLHEMSRDSQANKSQTQLEAMDRVTTVASASKITDHSRTVFEETKRRKYTSIYDALVQNDPEEKLRCSTLCLQMLDADLAEFLRPLVAYLKETKATLEFESFCAALDYQRQHSAKPTSHLFVQRSTKSAERYRQESSSSSFVPQLDARSNKIASRHRTRHAPIHEQLLREREATEAKLHEQREMEEQKKFAECTFAPNAGTGRAHRSSASGCNSGVRSPRLSGAAQALGAARSDPMLYQGGAHQGCPGAMPLMAPGYAQHAQQAQRLYPGSTDGASTPDRNWATKLYSNGSHSDDGTSQNGTPREAVFENGGSPTTIDVGDLGGTYDGNKLLHDRCGDVGLAERGFAPELDSIKCV